MKNPWNGLIRQTDNVLYEIFRGADFGEIVAKEIHKNIYEVALKQTEILDGAKLPWNARYPLIKRIGGYNKPLEKLAGAVKIATQTRDQIEDVLKGLYQERDNRIASTEQTKKQIKILEETLHSMKNKEGEIITEAKSEIEKGLEALEQELKKEDNTKKIIDGREFLKKYSNPVKQTTEIMKTEDALQKQIVNTEALETSVEMLDIIIRDYRTLLNLFNKRAAYATAFSEILTKAE